MGATLSHRSADGCEKVIYHASRCLTQPQKNYQIEKEAFALIFAMQKFHRSIHGRNFTLRIDHKPFLAIFGSKKEYSANRLQRWTTILLNYNFTIEYKNTKDFDQLDALSRLVSSQSSIPEDFVLASIDGDVTSEFSENYCQLPASAESIRTATQTDRLIQLVTGNRPKFNRHSPLWHYYNRINTMTTVKGCLLTASRIVIPKSLRNRVFSALHKAHPGQTRMKMLARRFVYLPTIDFDIENSSRPAQDVHQCERIR
ncbi:hypothetical protein RB195_026527 [Necator americanus]|uniref:RNA-directed DNA polymerase n=1 Tax=Necator americanus TaxID=51031 RepID=A0ABR1EWP1_NECAM